MLTVGQKVSVDNRMRLESDRNLAGNRFAVRVQGFRNVDADQAGRTRRHVVLPAAPDYGVALAHQEAIARPQPLPGAVEVGQYGGVAPVHHVKQDAVAAPRRVFGLQDAEVGDAVRAAGGIPGSQLQVGDDFVGRVVGVNCQVNQAVYLPIGAGLAENRPVGKGPNGSNLQSGNCHYSDLQYRMCA